MLTSSKFAVPALSLSSYKNILLRNSQEAGEGQGGPDLCNRRSCEHLTIGGEAGDSDCANTEKGEEEEAFMLCAVIAVHVILLNL